MLKVVHVYSNSRVLYCNTFSLTNGNSNVNQKIHLSLRQGPSHAAKWYFTYYVHGAKKNKTLMIFRRVFWYETSKMFHNIKCSRDKWMESNESRQKPDSISASHIVGIIAMHKCSQTTMIFYLTGKKFSVVKWNFFSVLSYDMCEGGRRLIYTIWPSYLLEVN